MKKRSNRLLALMLSAAMIAPSAASVMPVYAEEVTAEEAFAEEDAELLEEEAAEEPDAEVEDFAFAAEDTAEYEDLDAAFAGGFIEDEEEVAASAWNAEGEEVTLDAVKALIAALPKAGEVKNEDADQITAAQKAFEALSAEDQKTLDEESITGADSSQPYGRVLESNVWELASLQTVDNSTTLPDGTYTTTSTPAFTTVSDKGKSTSNRVRTWTWTEITVTDGKAFGTLTVDSKTYPQVQVNGTTYTRDGDKSTSKTSVFANVPVDLNGDIYISANSSSMPQPIAYKLTTTIEEPAVVDPADEKPVSLTVTNNTGMFNVTKALLDKKNDQLTITLSGKGYHNLYKGTYAQAVANGTAVENWIAGDDSTGKWQFTIPLEDGVSFYPIVAISDSYYNKYKNGANPIERSFYARQFVLDRENLTLVTGDYEETVSYPITNNVKMFKPGDVADVHSVGCPNSNGYLVTMTLTMGSTSYDKAFVGTAAEAEAAADADVVSLSSDKQFALTVAKNAKAAVLLIDILDKPSYVSFHSAKKNEWYERKINIDTTAKTITFDVSEANYEAVDAAIASIPEDLSIYTEESAAAVTAAKDAVVTGKFASQQEEVDAMAKAVNDAVAALVKKEVETEEPQTEEPQTEKPEPQTEEPQTEEPQTEKPEPQTEKPEPQPQTEKPQPQTEKPQPQTEKPANTEPKTGSVVTSGSAKYEVLSGSTVAFAGDTTASAKKITVPETVKVAGKTYTVTEVKADAFKNNKKLTTVTIGKNVTKIGDNAFSGCKALKKVTIKTTKLKTVGKNAFKKAGSNNYKKLTVKVPKKKLTAYKKLLKKGKLSKKAKVKK